MIITIRNCLLRSYMTNCSISKINVLGISVPANDNYLEAIEIYKKLIADVFYCLFFIYCLVFWPAGEKVATGMETIAWYRVIVLFMQMYKNHGNSNLVANKT